MQESIALIHDRKLISDYLSLDRVWASEALMSLDDRIWSVASWYGHQEGTNLGLALMFKHLSPTPVFLAGEPNCLAYIIRSEIIPKTIFVEAPISCIGILKEHYHFDSALIMHKMKLEHFRFNSFPVSSEVRRLAPEDFPKARDLYFRNVEKGVFDVDQFNHGIYFGVQKEDKLVSMAGTTVLCFDYRTATIGNVITDSDYRNKGYATSALLLLCQSLQEEVFDCISIKVNRGNAQAILLYRRIGFIKKNEYFEGIGKSIRGNHHG